jgi:hypothetical protein
MSHESTTSNFRIYRIRVVDRNNDILSSECFDFNTAEDMYKRWYQLLEEDHQIRALLIIEDESGVEEIKNIASCHVLQRLIDNRL